MLVFGQVMAYRTDAFNGTVPHGWADFWDVKSSPAIARSAVQVQARRSSNSR
jgi:hypothetical protein